MRTRKLLALLALGAAALALGGCVVFKGAITGSQVDIIGKVRVLFTVCASEETPDGPGGVEDHPGCEDAGNNGDQADNGDFQLLLAFRVPAGTKGPASFTSTSGEVVTFRPKASYAQQLTTLVPPPPGFEWLGYISDPYVFDDGAEGVPAREASFAVDFELPRTADGNPFAGPFKIRPVVGGRNVDPADPASVDRPVSCGDDVFGGGGGPFSDSVDCIDSPSEADTATNIDIPTRDLAIGAGTASGATGTTANVPFSANYSGAAPGTSFALAASSTLAGAGVGAASPATFTPGPSGSDPVSVPVAIPSDAVPGTYDVTLVATLPNGQTRSGVARLTVTDGTDPVARALSVKPQTFTPTPSTAPIAAARQPRVSYRLSEAATMRFTVRRCRGKRCKALKGSFRHAGKAGSNSFRFTGFLRGKALRRGSYKLVGVPTDAASNRGKSVSAKFGTRRPH